jgi:hypothetical protein
VAFTDSDVKQIESFLSSMTNTWDAVGKAKRDTILLMRKNDKWPSGVTDKLNEYIALFNYVLSQGDSLEGTLLSNAHLETAVPM